MRLCACRPAPSLRSCVTPLTTFAGLSLQYFVVLEPFVAFGFSWLLALGPLAFGLWAFGPWTPRPERNHRSAISSIGPARNRHLPARRATPSAGGPCRSTHREHASAP